MRGVRKLFRAKGAVVGAALLVAVTATLVGVAVPERALAANTVQVGQQNGGTAAGFQFNAATILVKTGDTVHWTLFTGTHTVTAFDETTPGTPDWTSGTLVSTFDHTFTTPGVYTYYCQFHATRAAADPANVDARIAAGFMVGKIVVETPSVGGVAHLPSPRGGAGGIAAAGSDSGLPWWPAAVAAIATGLLLCGGLVAIRRRAPRA